MEAFICGTCRIDTLPRITLIVQWDRDGVIPKGCGCSWDGNKLNWCSACSHLSCSGTLVQAAEAFGWQGRRLFYPLRYVSPDETTEAIASSVGLGPFLYPALSCDPSAPPLDPVTETGTGKEAKNKGKAENLRCDLLNETIDKAWPFQADGVRAGKPLVGLQEHPVVFRVFREPLTMAIRPDERSDDAKETALKGGWEGPWELTTWASLIKEVIENQFIPLTDLPAIPREERVRASDLYYYTTNIDAWCPRGTRPKQKAAIYTVTSEAWNRQGILQIPGTVAQRTRTPIRPDSTCKVRIAVQMVIVPLKGVYSIGATITVLARRREEFSAHEAHAPLPKVPEPPTRRHSISLLKTLTRMPSRLRRTESERK
ncbi:uncharacterized protein LOC106536852 [Austrofundulus limnaeus]|uniref:Uncharacterized protein LOC106536852 n=1 Tax=Austrofundulus limnaeus TaxID=52670 RepID=A0A2I4DBN5_AUSLI|nr:PREDICTED: uncharacterized protein LOC106536852 [Austrofundulus limnaeus]